MQCRNLAGPLSQSTPSLGPAHAGGAPFGQHDEGVGVAGGFTGKTRKRSRSRFDDNTLKRHNQHSAV